jgi:hypothetical protein
MSLPGPHPPSTRAASPPSGRPRPLPLQRLVDGIDATPDPALTAALLRITDPPLQVGRLLLEGAHPLDVLLGFTAPASWVGLGLRCQGHAYDLGHPPDPLPSASRDDDPPGPTADLPATPATIERCRPDPGVVRPGPGERPASAGGSGPAEGPPSGHDGRRGAGPLSAASGPAVVTAGGGGPTGPGGRSDPGQGGASRDDLVEPVPVVVTVLVDRAGRGAGALRRGTLVTRLDGPPEGVVGDACRRALGLPTRPPPPSTVDLWLRVWLDRLVEALVFADDTDRFGTWSAVAALHPAAPGQPTSVRANPRSTRAPAPTADAYMLADATLQLATTWPWSRLRHEPEVVDTGQPPLPRHLTDWMDDGMFARWVLADMVDLPVLARSLDERLPGRLVAAIAETVVIAGLPWGGPERPGFDP